MKCFLGFHLCNPNFNYDIDLEKHEQQQSAETFRNHLTYTNGLGYHASPRSVQTDQHHWLLRYPNVIPVYQTFIMELHDRASMELHDKCHERPRKLTWTIMKVRGSQRNLLGIAMNACVRGSPRHV